MKSDFERSQDECTALRTQNEMLRRLLAQHGGVAQMAVIPRTEKTILHHSKANEDKSFSDMSGAEKTELFKRDPKKYEEMKNSAMYFNG